MPVVIKLSTRNILIFSEMMGEIGRIIVTVMGKELGPGGAVSEELVDRCRLAAAMKIVVEVQGVVVRVSCHLMTKKVKNQKLM